LSFPKKMSLFRKPKKTLRNRGPLELEDDDEQDNSIEEIHSNISKLKQKKKDKKKNKEKPKDEKKSLLSFDDEVEEEEEFVIKKSKESRRLIKQKERVKKDDYRENRSRKNSPDIEIYTPKPKNGGSTNKYDNNVKIIDDDIEIVLKDTVTKKPVDTWVISGKEAEALHLEEEDFSEDEEIESDEEDPLKKIIQSRWGNPRRCCNPCCQEEERGC